jgi:hypothetical protein
VSCGQAEAFIGQGETQPSGLGLGLRLPDHSQLIFCLQHFTSLRQSIHSGFTD